MSYDHKLLMNYRNVDISGITENFENSNPFKYYVSKEPGEGLKDQTFRAEHNAYLITNNRVRVIRSFSDDFARVIRHKSNEVLQKFKGSIMHSSLAVKMKEDCENEMQKFMSSLGFEPEEYLIECNVQYETHLHSTLNIDIRACRIQDGVEVTNLTNLDFELYEYIGLRDGSPFQLFEGTELRRVQGAKIYKFLKN